MTWGRTARVLAGIAVVAVGFGLAMCSSADSTDDHGGPEATLQAALRAHASGDLDTAVQLYR
jgi:hypothetical protein